MHHSTTDERPALAQLFAIDLRSLALFRIGLALTILIDLPLRARFLVAHYTDAGVLPRADAIAGFIPDAALSIHLMSGHAWAQAALMLLAAVFAFGLLIGCRTRLCAVATWILLLSLHNRNPAILNGGDSLLRALSFWAMFLPLGAACSIDAARGSTSDPPPSRILSIGSAALLLQVAIMYVFTAVLKTGHPWKDGSAVAYALSLDAFRTVGGDLLFSYRELLGPMTHATIWLERVAPVLAFAPLCTARLRMLIVPLFMLFHAGLGVTMHLGLFPFACIVAWTPFLPSTFWDGAGDRAARLSDAAGRALARAASWPAVEGLAARPRWRPSRIGQTVALGMLGYTLLANAATVTKPAPLWEEIAWVGDLTRMNQRWSMFAPRPRMTDGWYVAEARLASGEIVDLQTGRPVSFAKPGDALRWCGGARMRKFTATMYAQDDAPRRALYTEHLVRRWSATQPVERRVERVTLWFMCEPTRWRARPPDIYRVALHEWPEPAGGPRLDPAAALAQIPAF